MKKFIILAILIISNMGIFGVGNTGGEENTKIQEIVANEPVQEVSVVEEQNEKEEKIEEIADETENKQEEKQTDYQEQVTVNKEIKKEQPTQKTNATDNSTNNKQETKKVEQKPQENKQQEQKKEQPVVTNEKAQETKPIQENKVKQCTNEEHAKISGNTNKWYDTKEDAIAFAETEQKKWGEKWTNFEIDDEEYDEKCPYSHKEWDCPNCKKWTLDLYYRKNK